MPVVISHHKCAGPQNWGRTVQTLAHIDAARARQPIGLDAYPYVASSSSLAAMWRIGRERNTAALEMIKSAGLHVTFNLLMFEPDCTLADLRDNTAMMREYSRVPLNFCRAEVYSGTGLEADKIAAAIDAAPPGDKAKLVSLMFSRWGLYPALAPTFHRM